MRIAWDESRVEGNVFLIERKKLLGRIERNVVRIARGVIIVRTVHGVIRTRPKIY